MFSSFLTSWLTLLLLAPLPAAARELRVCADPNNLPFSNEAREGFENRIMALVADELGEALTYVWWAQRRGVVTTALNEGFCDIIPGIGSVDGVLRTYPPLLSLQLRLRDPGGRARRLVLRRSAVAALACRRSPRRR